MDISPERALTFQLSTGGARPGYPQSRNSCFPALAFVSRVLAVNPIDALGLCGGAARWTRLRDLGVSERGLTAAVRSGVVLAVGRGAYALSAAPASLVAAVQLGGVASHSTAAALHGWPIWTPDKQLHVTVLSGSGRTLPGATVHQARLQPTDLDPHRACTAPLRTALDCARTMPLVEAVCVLDGAIRCGSLTARQLRDGARGTLGPGTSNLRRAIANVDPRSGSPLESVLRMLLLATGASVRSQVHILGVGDVDFLLDEWLMVEGDGYEFHSNRSDYRRDRQRGNGLTFAGHPLLRFTYEDVRGAPFRVMAEVEWMLRRGRTEHQ